MTEMAKANIETENHTTIKCLFNPAELSIAKSAQWSPTKAPGKNAPKLKFTQGQPGTMSLNLTFDTTDTGASVTEYTDALLGLVSVDKRLKDTDKRNNSARPPWVIFHWGDFHSFKAIVENLQIRFTYFASDGTPLRAQCSLSLKQYEDTGAWGKQNPTSGTPNPHTVHVVSPGETLDRIAALHYGDPARWRLLAAANEVLDPLELEPGTPLVVPEMETVSRG
jgi:nucleoid-associated protein YgaU